MVDILWCSIWRSKYLGKCKVYNVANTRNLMNLQLEMKLLWILGGKKCVEPKTDQQLKTIILLINSYYFFCTILGHCHKLIRSNLDKLKKKHFQALKNVIGNGYLINYGCFYLTLAKWEPTNGGIAFFLLFEHAHCKHGYHMLWQFSMI